ncbi:MAG TPA: beta-phosphoglucomutase [Candidatus Tectomicrobia bacterium]|jgi:beta-phosphoglucomutase
MPIHGCIFDLDGVLTDTAEYHYQAWQRLADELDIPFDRASNEALRGVSRRQSLELLLAGRVYPEAQMLEMMACKNRYYQALLTQVTPHDLLPGVRHLLETVRAAGLKIAIGSASKNAREVVQRLGIAPYLDGLADGNSVVRPKPAPDLFVYAAGLLRVCVNECVVFEDAAVGVDAAKTAGMFAVGLGPVQRVGQADLVLPDLSRVTLDDILQHLSHRTHILEDKT